MGMKNIHILKKLYRKRSRSMRTFALIAIAGLFLGIGLTVRQAFVDYAQTHEQARKEAQRLSRLLALHVNDQIATTDLLLQQAAHRHYLANFLHVNLTHDIRQDFKQWLNQRKTIEALVLINEHGKTEIASNRPEAKNWINYHQSFQRFAPFVALQKEGAPPLYVLRYHSKEAQPFYGMILARRINKPDGTFGGIVLAALNTREMMHYFDSITTRSLAYMDVILHHQESIFTGMDYARLWQGRTALHTIQPTAHTIEIDSEKIIIGQQELAPFSLNVYVAIKEDDYLNHFWRERFKEVTFVVIFLIVGISVSLIVFAMASQVTRVEQSEKSAILASQAKSEFLANMSHELRTPLNAIIGFSEMMNGGYFGPLNARQKERMADITLCGNHLLQLINDILEFSKGEAGRLDLVEEKVSINEIFDETVRIMNEKIKSKGIKIIVDVAPKLPLLFADKRKITQILINLLSNAVKFTQPTGTITLSARIESNHDMVIEVSDTGIGIANEDIPIALAVFGQVHRSQNQEGTGLGLPLCRMFTELHGGVFTLISALGVGTTIRMQFPSARIVLHDSEKLETQLLSFPPNISTRYQQ
ncbi:MAG: hypothetical protein EAY65_07370 [Alphaproteobacteria bacterium]|nr:MAG: hypothetical protein EAY65_07370 [Alphaproteobacteria bacterium]